MKSSFWWTLALSGGALPLAWSLNLGVWAFPALALLLLFLAPWTRSASRLNSAGPKPNSYLLHSRLFTTLRPFLPLLWPCSLRLRLHLLSCFLILLAGRVLNVYQPLVNKNIVDGLQSCFRPDLIVASISLLLLQRVLDVLHGLLWTSIEQHVSLRIQSRFFSHVHALPHSWHTRSQTGDLFTVAELGSDGFNDVVEHLVFSIGPAAVDILISILYLSTVFSGWVGLVVVGQVIAYFAVTARMAEWKKRLQRPLNSAARAKQQRAMDSLMNHEVVKSFTNEGYECEQMVGRIRDFQDCEWSVNAVGKLMDLVQGAITVGGQLVATLLVGWMVYKNECSLGAYFLFFTHFGQLNGLLRYFGGYYRSITRSLVNMEALIEMLREEPESDYAHVTTPTTPKLIPKVVTKIAGYIEFRGVSFGYGDGEKPLIKDVSFTVAPGESLAIVGPSGEGKSTILKLLLRFYDPSSGQILLDGRDLRDYPRKELRRAMGLVPQDTILFNGTVEKNIRYGRVEATDKEVITASRQACIHERCLALPGGYGTQVGGRGSCLSGGERLRVTLARMFLKQPHVYLLDEATSSLDPLTERAVMEQLRKLSAGKTMVVVTHRLGTTVGVDRIIVLAGGRIIENGPHMELLEEGGVYARMWGQQQREE